MTATTPDALRVQRLMFAKTIFADEAIPLPPPSVRTRETIRKPRTMHSSWWAMMLCGLVAGFFTGAAVFASPLGRSPTLERISAMIADFTQ